MTRSIRPAFALTATSRIPDVAPAAAEGQHERGEGVGEPGQRCRGRECRSRVRDGTRAESRDERPRDEEHRRDRADRDEEERDAECALRQVGRVLHARQHRGPRAPEEPERREADEGGRPTREREVVPGGVGLPERPPGVPPVAPGCELGFEPSSFRADVTGLILREAALLDAHVEQLVVLPLDPAVRMEDQIELEVLRVVAGRGAPERLLQVEVPAPELALLAVPEHPDRVASRRGAGASARRDPASARGPPTDARPVPAGT